MSKFRIEKVLVLYWSKLPDELMDLCKSFHNFNNYTTIEIHSDLDFKSDKAPLAQLQEWYKEDCNEQHTSFDEWTKDNDIHDYQMDLFIIELIKTENIDMNSIDRILLEIRW